MSCSKLLITRRSTALSLPLQVRLPWIKTGLFSRKSMTKRKKFLTARNLRPVFVRIRAASTKDENRRSVGLVDDGRSHNFGGACRKGSRIRRVCSQGRSKDRLRWKTSHSWRFGIFFSWRGKRWKPHKLSPKDHLFQAGLGWAGLGWAGLGWAGLGRAGLGLAGDTLVYGCVSVA